MTKTTKAKNGRKVNTFVKNSNYTLSFTRPTAGVKDESTFLNVSGFNPSTGEFGKVRLDGRAVTQLRKVLAS